MNFLKRQKEHSRIDHLDQMVPFLFALGCARAWVTLAFAAPDSYFQPVGFDVHIVFDYSYALAGIVVALAARHLSPLQESSWARPTVLALMLASSVCILAIQGYGVSAGVLSVVASILGGIGFCLFLLLHAEALMPLSLVRIALYTAGSRLIAVPLVFFCEGFDELRLQLIILLLPIISVGCVSYAYRLTPVSERPKRSYPKFTFPWKPVALLCVFSFAYGMGESHLSAGAGMHSTLSTALIMGIFFLVVYLFSDRFSISFLYRSPLVLLACGVLLIPAQGLLGDVVAGYLISMSYTLMSLLVSLLFYDLSKRLGIAIIAIAGAAKMDKVFSVWGSDFSAMLEANTAASQFHDVIAIVAIVGVVLVGVLILLSEKELASTWGVRAKEAGGLAVESRIEEVLAQRCSEITRQYRLSPREDEILRLLAHGKTNAAIERELVIASGTLKAHIQHIYVKTDVHSRKELLEMILPKEETKEETVSTKEG